MFWMVDILGTCKSYALTICMQLQLKADRLFISFGYVVEGADFLKAVEEGDIIVSAKVTEGAENLILPK